MLTLRAAMENVFSSMLSEAAHVREEECAGVPEPRPDLYRTTNEPVALLENVRNVKYELRPYIRKQNVN